MVELEAANRTELRNRLRFWGENAPDRLVRRGRQKELERWILNRFLRAMDRAGRIKYPIAVSEDENPDFRVQFATHTLEIEVTEAVDRSEQEQWTREAKDEASVTRPISLEDPARRCRVRGMVKTAHAKKSARCSESLNALLMYLNTQSAAFEEPDALVSWLSGSIPCDTRFRFVWMVHGSHVYDLREMRLLATLDGAS